MTRTKNLHPNVSAFLDMLSFSEGTNRYGNDEGYNVIVGGKLFDSYEKHPGVLVRLNSKLTSTAAGRYQILERYWNTYRKQLNLPDFSPESQDAYAVNILKERCATKPLEAGDIKTAIKRCANIWASLPGAGYGQRENKEEVLIAKYKEFGGNVNC